MRWFGKTCLVLAITALLHGVIYISGAIPFFDFRLFDIVSKKHEIPPTKPFSSTVVVEIDEESLRQFGQWPWPRLITAKIVQEILQDRPSALGLDIFFPEADRTSPKEIQAFYKLRMGLDVSLEGFPKQLEDHDRIFANALGIGKSVLPFFISMQREITSTCKTRQTFLPLDGVFLGSANALLCSLPILQQNASGEGFINASVDSDGVFRRQPLLLQYKDRWLPSLGVAMLLQIDKTLTVKKGTKPWESIELSFLDKKVPMNARAEVLSPLYAKERFQRVSAVQVASKSLKTGFFTGKLVLLGATAAGLYDQYITPNGDILPGVFVHGALLENIMAKTTMYQPESSKIMAFGMSFLGALLLVWLIVGRHYLYSWGIYILGVITSFVLTSWMLQQHVYPSLGYFLIPFSFLFFIISLFFAVLHFIERKRFLEDLGEAHSATIDSMTMVAESRDVETGAHIIRTKEYVKLLAEFLYRNHFYKNQLNVHTIDLMYRAAPMHDIGKVGIPDSILQKPGRLDADEMRIMRRHSDIGRTIIQNAINSYNKTNEFLTIASNIAYTHHERWDGTGYPQGLKGDAIPLEGRLMALADVYDALISKRCYKEAFAFEEAEEMILKQAGLHFDPTIIKAFFVLKEEFRAIAKLYGETITDE